MTKIDSIPYLVIALAIGGLAIWIITLIVLPYRRLNGLSSLRTTWTVTVISFLFVVTLGTLLTLGQPVCVGLSIIPAALTAYVTYVTIESPRISRSFFNSLADSIRKRNPPQH